MCKRSSFISDIKYILFSDARLYATGTRGREETPPSQGSDYFLVSSPANGITLLAFHCLKKNRSSSSGDPPCGRLLLLSCFFSPTVRGEKTEREKASKHLNSTAVLVFLKSTAQDFKSASPDRPAL